VVSGLRSSVGASRVLLLAIEAGVIVRLVSVAVVLEYEEVLTRDEHLAASGLEERDVEGFLDAFVLLAEHVVPHFRTRPLVRDADHEMFAELAVNAGADALVTFNIADYREAGRQVPGFGVSVCRPGEILGRLRWRPSAISPFGFLPH